MPYKYRIPLRAGILRVTAALFALMILALGSAPTRGAKTSATRLRPQAPATQNAVLPDDDDCNCPPPTPLRKTGELLDPERHTALARLYDRLVAGGRFSLEERSVLERFHAGGPVDDVEADVVASRALFARYVQHRELTPGQREIYDRYAAYLAALDREPADVKGAHSPIATATPEREPNDVAHRATRSRNHFFSGSFTDTADVDFYAVSTTTAGTVTVLFDADPARAGRQTTAVVEILDEGGNTLATSQGATRVVQVSVPEAGTYYARVSPDPAAPAFKGESGAYALGLSLACATGTVDREDPRFKRVHPFEQGQECRSGPMRNFEAYEFEVKSPGPIVASLCPDGGGAADFDSFLIVYQSPGGARIAPFMANACTNALAANNDFCGEQSQVSATVEAGYFYVVVTGRCGESLGNFTLNTTMDGTSLACARVTPPGGGHDEEEEGVTIEMTCAPDPAATNGEVAYSIVLANDGCPRQQVVATDPLPPETTFVSCTTTSGTYTVAGNTVTIAVGRMERDSVVTISIVARVSCAMATGETIANTVTVTGKGGGGGHEGEETGPLFQTSATMTSGVVNPPPTIAQPAPVGVTANALVGCTVGAHVAFAMPVATDNCPGPVTVSCEPASGSFFPQGTTTVTCTATDALGASAACSFAVTAYSPFGACCIDDYSGDSYGQVVDRANALYGYWQYRVAATGQVFCGMPDYLAYIPGRSLVSYDRTDPVCTMSANVSYASRTGTVRVVERRTGIQHVLRDRNTANTPPCQ